MRPAAVSCGIFFKNSETRFRLFGKLEAIEREMFRMKSIEQINEKIATGKAVVLTAEEVIAYADKKGTAKAAEEIDVVTTATFGPMCSSGCFINMGHSKPKMRFTEAWLDDVLVYSGIAAVDLYLGATQLRHNDPANMYHPGEFRFGGAHVIEKLISGQSVQFFGLSYGTDEYPRRETRTQVTLDDVNQAIMVNPRNCYQNYNVAVNGSDRTIYTYLGQLKPKMKNAGYSSAGQLSPLLNDPYYRTIGIGSAVWLAGSKGHVHAEGTQHAPLSERGENGVPVDGAGTLGLTADMKQMYPEFIRALSLKGYGVSLCVGVGIPIPILDEEMLKYTMVRDEEILAPVIDYSHDYPQRTGIEVAKVSYKDLKSGSVMLNGKKTETGSFSSYAKALKIAELLKAEIRDGKFTLNTPIAPLSADRTFSPMKEVQP